MSILANILKSLIRPVFSRKQTGPAPLEAGANYPQAKLPSDTHDPSTLDLQNLVEEFAAGNYKQLQTNVGILLEIYPNSGILWKLLGASQEMLGEDSLQAMRNAVAIMPDDAQANANLAFAVQRRQRFAEAVQYFEQSVLLDPKVVAVHQGLGLALTELGQYEAAEHCFLEALDLFPDSAITLNNLALCHKKRGCKVKAIEVLEKALSLDPCNAYACNSMGAIKLEEGNVKESIVLFRRAIEGLPDYADANNNLAYALYASGDGDQAISTLKNQLNRHAGDEHMLNNLLYILSTHLGEHQADIARYSKQFGRVIAEGVHRFESWEVSINSNRRLKVGLISGDLRDHVVGHFLEGVLRSIVRTHSNKIEFCAYSNSWMFDDVSARIKASCIAWNFVAGMDNESLSRLIHSDKVDILIDLSGHTSGNRLPVFAYKPAPVQISWLGYWSTTGVAEIDYILADPYCLPLTDQCLYSETIVHLPETRLCLTAPDSQIEINTLPVSINGFMTFGCCNRIEKLNSRVIDVWARILNAIPDSRLILKSKQLAHDGVKKSVIAQFGERGIHDGQLVLEGPSSRHEYFETYHRFDIALDPFPFPGGATTVDALWMGVPVLALNGTTMLSRQGASLLMNSGMGDWVADNEDAYVELAIKASMEIDNLAKIRGTLRKQVIDSPIFDSDRFATHFYSALNEMWGEWCACHSQKWSKSKSV